MTPIEEALAKSRGARFWKCALQVNTGAYLAKWRGQHQTDLPEFNQNMLEACRNHGIEIVGLADHDDFEFYDDLAATLTAAGIKVFPGFEITSLEGFHMVCLYALGTSSQRLREFRGRWAFTPMTQPSRRIRAPWRSRARSWRSKAVFGTRRT